MTTKFKMTRGLTPAMYMLLGIFLLIFPGTALKTICMIIGILTLIYGGTKLAENLNGERSSLSLAFSVTVILAGLLLLFSPGFVVSILPILMGLYIIVKGAMDMKIAFVMRNNGSSRWGSSFVLSLLLIFAGILILSTAYTLVTVCVRIFGVAMVINGIFSLMTTSEQGSF